MRYNSMSGLNVTVKIKYSSDKVKVKDQAKDVGFKRINRYKAIMNSPNQTSLTAMELLCEEYLQVLDSWQSGVYNIRIMHHEVWRDLNHVDGIIERRAGSRVEKQTRVLPVGGKADVDYMFQVDGVLVGAGDGDHLEFQSSAYSKAYGKVIASKGWIEDLKENRSGALGKIFDETAFQSLDNDKKYLLKPNIFKENIFSHCNFEMQRSKVNESKPTGPSVSGKGALNEYDVVPCLKLDRWPTVAMDWQFMAKEDSYTIDRKLRKSMVESIPILLVPTGNPLSPTAEDEWRLSFSFVEIEIFNNLIPKQRQLYGLLKYLFKELFNEVDLLSSYHVKTLMLRKVDHEPLEYWERVRLVDFIVEMFEEMFSAVDEEFIPHLFIKECNIFPLHKTDSKKKQQFKDVTHNGLFYIIFQAINKTLLHDLTLDATETDLLKSGSKKLKEMAERGVQESYVAGYLTRLLSVSWYCLQETALRGTLHRPINQLKGLLERYKDDENIQRLLPMLEVLVTSMTGDRSTLAGADVALRNASEADKLSILAHHAFILYIKQEFTELKETLVCMEALTTKDSIGVTITKLQVDVDYPIDYLTKHMVCQLKSNRLYIEPRVLHLHLNIQLALFESILATEEGRKKLQNLVRRLIELVEKASDREPYLGKLSYKHAEIILLRGYEEYFKCKCEEQHGTTIVMPVTITEKCLRRRDSATNFNLR